MKTRMPVAVSSSRLQTFQYIVFSGIILYFGRTLFIPLSFAVLISFILYPICEWFESKSLKRLTSVLLSISILLAITAGLFALLIQQLSGFIMEWHTFKIKFSELISETSHYLENNFSIPIAQQQEWINKTIDQSGGDILTFLRQIFYSYTVSVISAILIPIFVTLILYYRKRLIRVIFLLFPVERRADINYILEHTITTYYDFIKGMIVVYVLVGALNSIGLLILGIPHPFLFGYVAAILTFIPYVGIIVGSLLPITVAWITYGSVWYPIGVILIFTLVQYLEANIIFPLAVSKKLKVNALVTLCVIILGGIIWGVAGMILFVPFLGIIKLIVDKNPRLKIWSIFLGDS